MKNWQTRLTETIALIRTTPAPWLRGDRNVVPDALVQWKQLNAGQAQTLSGLMSQVGTNPKPDKAGRKKRRAIILLRCAILEPANQGGWANIANQANALANPDAQFETWMKEARDRVFGSNPVATAQLTRLRTNPRAFLTDWPLLVNGSPNGAVVTYAVNMVRGMYRLDCVNVVGGRPTIQAFNIPAQSFAGVQGNLGAIPGEDVQGNTLALTTQFTGCAFCFEIHNASMVATHLDPTAAVGGGLLPQAQRATGDHIRQQLEAAGAFANTNGGTFRVFGRNPANGAYGYGTCRVIIVSAQINNAWQVYAQLQYTDDNWAVYRIDQGAMA